MEIAQPMEVKTETLFPSGEKRVQNAAVPSSGRDIVAHLWSHHQK